MRRLLFFIIILYVVWRVLNIVGRRLRRRAGVANPFRRGAGQDADRRGKTPATPEQLVSCARCGTLLPASRAVRGANGKIFCSYECSELMSNAGQAESSTSP